ncbi:MAG: hypothetical protein HY548_05075, partial [Elusimicrobia bacterium]|nr:hypothetical protein [Elusimicrobiota bacterium]
ELNGLLKDGDRSEPTQARIAELQQAKTDLETAGAKIDAYGKAYEGVLRGILGMSWNQELSPVQKAALDRFQTVQGIASAALALSAIPQMKKDLADGLDRAVNEKNEPGRAALATAKQKLDAYIGRSAGVLRGILNMDWKTGKLSQAQRSALREAPAIQAIVTAALYIATVEEVRIKGAGSQDAATKEFLAYADANEAGLRQILNSDSRTAVFGERQQNLFRGFQAAMDKFSAQQPKAQEPVDPVSQQVQTIIRAGLSGKAENGVQILSRNADGSFTARKGDITVTVGKIEVAHQEKQDREGLVYNTTYRRLVTVQIAGQATFRYEVRESMLTGPVGNRPPSQLSDPILLSQIPIGTEAEFTLLGIQVKAEYQGNDQWEVERTSIEKIDIAKVTALLESGNYSGVQADSISDVQVLIRPDGTAVLTRLTTHKEEPGTLIGKVVTLFPSLAPPQDGGQGAALRSRTNATVSKVDGGFKVTGTAVTWTLETLSNGSQAYVANLAKQEGNVINIADAATAAAYSAQFGKSMSTGYFHVVMRDGEAQVVSGKSALLNIAGGLTSKSNWTQLFSYVKQGMPIGFASAFAFEETALGLDEITYAARQTTVVRFVENLAVSTFGAFETILGAFVMYFNEDAGFRWVEQGFKYLKGYELSDFQGGGWAVFFKVALPASTIVVTSVFGAARAVTGGLGAGASVGLQAAPKTVTLFQRIVQGTARFTSLGLRGAPGYIVSGGVTFAIVKTSIALAVTRIREGRWMTADEIVSTAIAGFVEGAIFNAAFKLVGLAVGNITIQGVRLVDLGKGLRYSEGLAAGTGRMAQFAKGVNAAAAVGQAGKFITIESKMIRALDFALSSLPGKMVLGGAAAMAFTVLNRVMSAQPGQKVIITMPELFHAFIWGASAVGLFSAYRLVRSGGALTLVPRTSMLQSLGAGVGRFSTIASGSHVEMVSLQVRGAIDFIKVGPVFTMMNILFAGGEWQGEGLTKGSLLRYLVVSSLEMGNMGLWFHPLSTAISNASLVPGAEKAATAGLTLGQRVMAAAKVWSQGLLAGPMIGATELFGLHLVSKMFASGISYWAEKFGVTGLVLSVKNAGRPDEYNMLENVAGDAAFFLIMYKPAVMKARQEFRQAALERSALGSFKAELAKALERPAGEERGKALQTFFSRIETFQLSAHDLRRAGFTTDADYGKWLSGVKDSVLRQAADRLVPEGRAREELFTDPSAYKIDLNTNRLVRVEADPRAEKYARLSKEVNESGLAGAVLPAQRDQVLGKMLEMDALTRMDPTVAERASLAQFSAPLAKMPEPIVRWAARETANRWKAENKIVEANEKTGRASTAIDMNGRTYRLSEPLRDAIQEASMSALRAEVRQGAEVK